MGTPWDAGTYDRSSAPQQSWASEVLARLEGLAPDATVLDVGCGTGRVTEALLALVPQGRVLAIDASQEMVDLARERLGDRARAAAAGPYSWDSVARRTLAVYEEVLAR